MTSKEARKIAEEYVISWGEVFTGFRFGIGEETEFQYKYYFDFIWLALDGNPATEPPVAGGARGLTVDKETKKIELISHGTYTGLVHEENELNKLYNLLSNFKNHNSQLSEMKSRFNLNSKELLNISKLLKDTTITRETIYAVAKDLLNRKNETS